MPSEYDIKNAVAQIKLARFLLTRADNRGFTHGEKHYIIQTALWLLMDATYKLDGLNSSFDMRNEVEEISSSDIPF